MVTALVKSVAQMKVDKSKKIDVAKGQEIYHENKQVFQINHSLKKCSNDIEFCAVNDDEGDQHYVVEYPELNTKNEVS